MTISRIKAERATLDTSQGRCPMNPCQTHRRIRTLPSERERLLLARQIKQRKAEDSTAAQQTIKTTATAEIKR